MSADFKKCLILIFKILGLHHLKLKVSQDWEDGLLILLLSGRNYKFLVELCAICPTFLKIPNIRSKEHNNQYIWNCNFKTRPMAPLLNISSWYNVSSWSRGRVASPPHTTHLSGEEEWLTESRQALYGTAECWLVKAERCPGQMLSRKSNFRSSLDRRGRVSAEAHMIKKGRVAVEAHLTREEK